MVKKLFFASFFLFGLASAVAQNLQITSADSVIYGNTVTSADIVSHIAIQNTGSSAIDVRVTRRLDFSNPLIDSNAICWLVCFDTDVDTSLTTLTLAPGERNENDFAGHVYPDGDGVVRNGTITYIFYDVANPSDSVSVTVLYQLTPDFSTNETAVDWRVYPNPAVDRLWIDAGTQGSEKSQFELTDLLGRKVLSQQINTASGRVSVNLSEMRSGVYIYSLYAEGSLIEKKKLIIRR